MTMFILMWVAVIALFAMLFQGWYDSSVNPNQQLNRISEHDGVREVVLERNRYNHYIVSGHINSNPVVFMVDTGATDVSIPEHIARRIGLASGAEIEFQTANGPARGYMTRLERVQIGNIVLNDIRASINPNVRDDEILLGMSFLKRIEFSQKGNTLTLRQDVAAQHAR